MVGDVAEDLDAAVPFLFGRARTAELPDRGVERPGQSRHAGGFAAVHDETQTLGRGGTHRRIGRDRVVLGVADRDRRALEAEVVELAAKGGESLGIRIEDRELDAVEAHLLQTAVERQPRLVDRVVGPEKEVHSDLHA